MGGNWLLVNPRLRARVSIGEGGSFVTPTAEAGETVVACCAGLIFAE
jgi:hypothetical protein